MVFVPILTTVNLAWLQVCTMDISGDNQRRQHRFGHVASYDYPGLEFRLGLSKIMMNMMILFLYNTWAQSVCLGTAGARQTIVPIFLNP